MIEKWVLPAFAFAVSTAYWPFWHDGAVSPKWIVLAALPLTLFWVRLRMTAGHLAIAALLLYGALSVLWSVAPLDSINSIARFCLLAAAFLIAAEMGDIRRTIGAISIGVSISAAIALMEVIGWVSVPEANHPAALFGNRNYLGEVSAVCLVLAVGYRMRWAIPGTLLALALTMSKAAFLGVGCAAFVGIWGKSRFAACAALVGSCIAGFVASQIIGGFDGLASLDTRLAIWASAISNMTVFGHGAGSFQAMYVLIQHYAEIPLGRPENAHNEFINLAFELGVPGIIAAAILAAHLWRSGLEVERCALAAIGAEAAFGFPLHLPTAGFLAAIVAGRLCARSTVIRDIVRRSRTKLYEGNERIGSSYGTVGV